jgi:hypothetical protein
LPLLPLKNAKRRLCNVPSNLGLKLPIPLDNGLFLLERKAVRWLRQLKLFLLVKKEALWLKHQLLNHHNGLFLLLDKVVVANLPRVLRLRNGADLLALLLNLLKNVGRVRLLGKLELL